MNEIYIFMVRIAALTIEVRTRFETVKNMFYYFMTEDQNASPDFQISVSEELFAFAEKIHRERTPDSSDVVIESLALQYDLCNKIINYGGMVIHASSLQMDNEAFVFTAPSTTGKSTHSRMWREVFKEQVAMINDDMPILRKIDDVWYVCGTPWNGKHGLGFNCMVPLKAISLFSRGQNSIRKFENKDWSYFLNQIHRPYEAELMERTFHLLEELMEDIPVYHMYCKPNHEAAEIARKYMVKEKI